jgi:hypothetical protein
MKRCRRCRVTKPLSDFALNKLSADGHNDRCRACFRDIYQLDREARLEQMARRRLPAREAARQWVADYLREHPCTDCGTTDVRVLEFDHRPDEVKRWAISRMIGGAYNVETIADEVARCDVRCANCHRKMTEARMKSARHRAEVERRAQPSLAALRLDSLLLSRRK